MSTETQKQKFTGWPWEHNGECLIYGQSAEEDSECPFVADTARDGASHVYTEEERANARLCAAAPELLAALECYMNGVEIIDGQDITSFAIAAIKKAYGE